MERSPDGAAFHALGTVPGAGHSLTTLHYRWTDDHPLPETAYYRLRQTDHGGSSTLSPVVAVRMPAADVRVELEEERLLMRSDAEGAWQLLDAMGRSVGTGTLAAGAAVRIPLSGVASAMLCLRIVTPYGRHAYQVVPGAGGVVVER